MHAWLEIVRPGNVAMAGIGCGVGAFVAAGGTPALAPAGLAIAATMAVTAGGNALNDARDAGVDGGAHPSRPVPSGRIARRDAYRLAGGLLAAGVLASAPVPLLKWVVVAAVASLLLYELALKRLGVPGNVAVGALVGLTVVAGASSTGGVPAVAWFLAALAFLVNVARELLKDVEDAPHDAGRRTLGQRAPRVARAAAGVLVVAAVALSVVPAARGWLADPYAYLVAPADLAFLVAVLAPSPRLGQRLLKTAMVGALAAFAAGVVE